MRTEVTALHPNYVCKQVKTYRASMSKNDWKSKRGDDDSSGHEQRQFNAGVRSGHVLLEAPRDEQWHWREDVECDDEHWWPRSGKMVLKENATKIEKNLPIHWEGTSKDKEGETHDSGERKTSDS